jgi:diketogulonate reductase-like aldo/keto reductase
MKEAIAIQNGKAIVTNQVLYNLMRRGIEWELLPWCRQHQIPIMAYSPVEQGRLLQNQTLKKLAQQRGVSPAQLAIAWLLQQKNVIVIPKASRIDHVEQNRAALDLKLNADELAALDRAFPPPTKPTPLEML